MNPWRRRVAKFLVSAALLGCGYAWGVTQFGSAEGLRQRMAGQRLIVANPLAEVGAAPPGTPRPFAFRVRNCGVEPVLLVGMRTGCGCVTSAAFPLTVPPGAWHTIAGEIRPTAAGRQVRSLELYSDDPSAGRVAVQVAVVGAEPSPRPAGGQG